MPYKNPEDQRINRLNWRKKDRERTRAIGRKEQALFRRRHPEKVQAHNAQYRAFNREKIRLKEASHPEMNSARCARRRARRLGATISNFTATQWHIMKEHLGNRCVYCGQKTKRLTQDHLTPLIKGGNHTVSNILPACQRCNSSKNAGPVLTPVQPFLFLPDISRKQKAHST